jgi:hypothetical protein
MGRGRRPTPSLPGVEVNFIALKDGDAIPTKSTIHFGLRGMGAAPACSDRANSGYHHLIVDTPMDQIVRFEKEFALRTPANTGTAYARERHC